MAGRKGGETRARIEAEALKLFARKGVDATSMRDLAAAVGVAEAAIYRYFDNKEAIGRAVFTLHYRDLAGKVSEIASQPRLFPHRLRALVEMFCDLFEREPDIFAFLLIHQHAHLRYVADDPQSNAAAALVLMMEQAYQNGDILEGDAELAAAMALGAVVQPAVFKLYGRLPGSLTEHSDALVRAALGAVGAV